MDKEIFIEKKILAILGIFFLIPPVFGVLAFALQLLGVDGDFIEMSNLSGRWTTCYGYRDGGGGGMSAAPIYLALMAFAGIWLIKDNLRYLLKKDKKANNSKNNVD